VHQAALTIGHKQPLILSSGDRCREEQGQLLMIDTTASTDGEILNKNPDSKWNAIQTAQIHSEIVELQAPKRPLKP